MQPNKEFKNHDSSFWAVIKLLNQRIGYFERKRKNNPNPDFVIPTPVQIIEVFKKEKLDHSKLINKKNDFTKFGEKVNHYFTYRKELLNKEVESNLMSAEEAKHLFHKHYKKLKPECPLPMNNQKGEKKDFSFLTGLVNMLIEENSKGFSVDYDPRELTSVTQKGFPVQTFSRRVDGAFPSVINPIAIWEIKEYYYTTTFGSRVADGVYETMLDGYEVREAEKNHGFKIKHYLIVDAHYTWWGMGKSYLCRMVDMMHMGLVDEVLIGKEVVTRIPELVKEWIVDHKKIENSI